MTEVTPSAEPNSSAALGEALKRIASTEQLLVALDFDGTLSETVDNPEDARALPGSRAAVLDLLALADTRVAVVSGRALASLARVSQLPSAVAMVGSHGSEFLVDGVESVPELDADQRALLSRVCEVLARVAAPIDGTIVESKPSGCGLHTRQCTREDAARAQTEAVSAVAGLDVPGLEVVGLQVSGQISSRFGKDILEFTVHTADKGTALSSLRNRLAASAVVFIGDDVTDEDGFRVLQPGDLSIKVGGGDSAAEYRVESPHALIPVLEQLVTVRAAALAARES